MNAEGVAKNAIGRRAELITGGDGWMDRLSRVKSLDPADRVDPLPGDADLDSRPVAGLWRGHRRTSRHQGGQ
jgi:hypothetical protein